MNRKAFSALVVVCVLSIAVQAAEPMHTADPLEMVKANVASGKAIIVDVREQREWDAGHLSGALHLPKSKLEQDVALAELLKKLDKAKIIYTHCGAGKRALVCGTILKKEGFEVRPLKPGYAELIDAGFEPAKQ